MRLTIIPEDKIVIINGISFFDIDLSWIDSSYHAIQWYEDHGEIEIYEGHRCVENRKITSIAEFQKAIDDWQIKYDKALSS